MYVCVCKAITYDNLPPNFTSFIAIGNNNCKKCYKEVKQIYKSKGDSVDSRSSRKTRNSI